MSKYSNKKVVYDGILFDSKKESRRYRELQIMQRAGLIKDLELQKEYELIPSQKDDSGKVMERSVKYRADFVYYDVGSRNTVVEDVKGYKTDIYKIKKKLMLWRYGIVITEV